MQQRLRGLRSRTGVYFVLALGLFPRIGYARVWAKLVVGLTGAGLAVPAVSEKALRELRRRLGPAPLKALFEVVAGPLAEPRTSGTCCAGLRTVAFDDGLNSLKVPDTDRNRGWMGRIRYRMGFAGYPTLRLMCLAETGTRSLLGATIGAADDRDEATLAGGCCRCCARACWCCSTAVSTLPPSWPRCTAPGRCCWLGLAASVSRRCSPTCPMAPTCPSSTGYRCGSSRPT
jgi:hypothetical protein